LHAALSQIRSPKFDIDALADVLTWSPVKIKYFAYGVHSPGIARDDGLMARGEKNKKPSLWSIFFIYYYDRRRNVYVRACRWWFSSLRFDVPFGEVNNTPPVRGAVRAQINSRSSPARIMDNVRALSANYNRNKNRDIRLCAFACSIDVIVPRRAFMLCIFYNGAMQMAPPSVPARRISLRY
jgi:hypothetical protein